MKTTWTIVQLDRELADGYVYTVHYRVDATDDTYSSGAYGTVNLEKPDKLIAYKDLTSDVVIGWVKAKLEAEDSDAVKNIEAALAAQIAEQKTPTVGSGTPWS
tara:strand:+ start:265 stop:573 length:309 start_codon:yes stop_codon:yes gene_type:complete